MSNNFIRDLKSILEDQSKYFVDDDKTELIKILSPYAKAKDNESNVLHVMIDFVGTKSLTTSDMKK